MSASPASRGGRGATAGHGAKTKRDTIAARWRDRDVLVLGCGLSGFSAARWLAHRGARVVVADTREAPPFESRLAAELPGVRLVKGPFDAALIGSAPTIVISPGVAKDQPAIADAVEKGADLVGDVELFARELPRRCRVVGITGSNGKSTVTALTGELLAAAGLRVVVCGNIGTPVLDALGDCERSGTWPHVFVVELSSYQLETTRSLALAAATVLNVTENHLDRYAGMADYAAAKARIFAHANAQVLSRDDAYSSSMRLPAHRVITFGASAPAADDEWGLVEHEGATWLAAFEQGRVAPLVDTSRLALVGRHNAQNALAALALAGALGQPARPLIAALESFRGLPHRMSRVGERNGVLYIEDSKATTVAAASAALEGIGRPAVLIAGGDGKGQDFSPLAPLVERHCRAVVLLGRDAPKLAAALAATRVPLVRVASLADAVARSARLAQPGDAVLLSPACASLDMFRDFAERGDLFAAAVRSLDTEEAIRA